MRKQKQNAAKSDNTEAETMSYRAGGGFAGKMVSLSESGINRTIHENEKDPTVHPESPRNNPSLH